MASLNEDFVEEASSEECNLVNVDDEKQESTGPKKSKKVWEIQVSTPAKINSMEELEEIYKDHLSWLESVLNPHKEITGGRANLSGAVLVNFDLSGFNFSGASFRNADLTGANLSHANLIGADFTNANLSRVNLTGAKLKRAIFDNANVEDAVLEGADLRGAVGIQIEKQ